MSKIYAPSILFPIAKARRVEAITFGRRSVARIRARLDQGHGHRLGFEHWRVGRFFFHSLYSVVNAVPLKLMTGGRFSKPPLASMPDLLFTTINEIHYTLATIGVLIGVCVEVALTWLNRNRYTHHSRSGHI